MQSFLQAFKRDETVYRKSSNYPPPEGPFIFEIFGPGLMRGGYEII